MKIEIPTIPSLAVRQLNGSKWWFVMEDYSIELLLDGVSYILFIPAGYRYDRATIWWQGFITKDQLGCVAALVHDVFCHYKGNIPNVAIALESIDTANITPWRAFSREQADLIFYKVMLADKIKPWRARVAYVFVTLAPDWEI